MQTVDTHKAKEGVGPAPTQSVRERDTSVVLGRM